MHEEEWKSPARRLNLIEYRKRSVRLWNSAFNTRSAEATAITNYMSISRWTKTENKTSKKLPIWLLNKLYRTISNEISLEVIVIIIIVEMIKVKRYIIIIIIIIIDHRRVSFARSRGKSLFPYKCHNFGSSTESVRTQAPKREKLCAGLSSHPRFAFYYYYVFFLHEKQQKFRITQSTRRQ